MTKLAKYSVWLFLIIGFVSGCAGSPTVVQSPTATAYTPRALTLHIKSSPQVNLYDGSAHALHVCVYQMSDPNLFNQFAETESGVSKLMRCERFDTGVTISHKYVFMPGEDKTYDLDRAENTKYVGVVAGYYSLLKDNSVRLFTIPMVEERRDNMIFYRQAPMTISLFLGPQALRVLGEQP